MSLDVDPSFSVRMSLSFHGCKIEMIGDVIKPDNIITRLQLIVMFYFHSSVMILSQALRFDNSILLPFYISGSKDVDQLSPAGLVKMMEVLQGMRVM